jgi:hypothetical protein
MYDPILAYKHACRDIGVFRQDTMAVSQKKREAVKFDKCLDTNISYHQIHSKKIFV